MQNCEVEFRKMQTKFLIVVIIIFQVGFVPHHKTSAYELDKRELNEGSTKIRRPASYFAQVEILNQGMKRGQYVLKNFVHIHAMKMDEYNNWWYPISLQECAENCLQDETMHCKSFSFCQEGEACSTFELSREDCPKLFNPPGHLKNDPRGHMVWDYFERKSGKYRKMEKQIEMLDNLTEISTKEATSVLNALAGMMTVDDVGEENKNQSSILPSELEMAGKSLMRVMELNPIANASLEVAREFTNLVVNVSSSLTKPSYAAVWQAAQKNPSSPGSSAIVTSAEELTKQVSEKLLTTQNATNGVVAESEGIAVWLDFASSNLKEEEEDSSSRSAGSWRSELGEEIERQSGFYTFPNRNVKLTSDTEWQQDAQGGNFEDEQSFFNDVITLPRAAFRNKSVVTNVRYKNLKEAMPTRSSVDNIIPPGAKLRENKMNSAVLTTSIYPRPPNDVFLDNPITIIFKHDRTPQSDQNKPGNISLPSNDTSSAVNSTIQKRLSEEDVFCVFWKDGESDNHGGEWSTDGCSLVDFNETHTTCNCTHLTSFAVLLQIVDYDVDTEASGLNQRVLSAVSKVGCVLSLLGVGIMCAAFVKLRFHTENMKIHFNLGLAVGLADLTFLFEEAAAGSKPSCAVVTLFLYYFNMAVLSWMLVEGFHLYSQVVVVFVSVRRRFKYYAAAGWGFPLFALTLSSGIVNNKLGSYESCWLSPSDNSIWAFAAPAIIVIVANTFVLLSVVRIIVKIRPGKSSSLKSSKLKNAVKGSVFLFPLLGTTWIFGLLAVSKETTVFQYIFAVINSLQGFFLFIFHCVCNSEVREDARRHKWFGSSDSTITSSNPHFLSHALTLNVASGLRRFRNSISFEIPSSHSSGGDEQSESDAKHVRKQKKINTMFTRMLPFKLPTTILEKEEKYEEDKHSSRTKANTDGVPQEEEEEEEVEGKHIPLPGMPVKNDKINLDKFKNHASEQNQFSGRPAQHTARDPLMWPAEEFKNCDTLSLGRPTICPLFSRKVNGPPSTLNNAQMSSFSAFRDAPDQWLINQMVQNALKEMFKEITPAEEELIKQTLFGENGEEEKRDAEKKMKMSYDSGLNSIDNESILDEDEESWAEKTSKVGGDQDKPT